MQLRKDGRNRTDIALKGGPPGLSRSFYQGSCQFPLRMLQNKERSLILRPVLWGSIMQNKGLAEIFKLVSIFVLVAVALGFFASIGIWAAVSFLRLFGIETL